jgi:hypothetical protein
MHQSCGYCARFASALANEAMTWGTIGSGSRHKPGSLQKQYRRVDETHIHRSQCSFLGFFRAGNLLEGKKHSCLQQSSNLMPDVTGE